MKQDTKQNISLTAYQKIVLSLLALTQFTVVLDFMILSPLGDMLMKSLDLSPAQFGFVVSAYAFSAGVSGFLCAGFVDRYDRKRILLFFYTGFIAGTVLCSAANSFGVLLAARIVTGLFAGVMSSTVMAIVTDLFSVQQRGRAMGFVQMGFGASQVLGIPIGLYIANLWGWQMPFLWVVVVATILWLVLAYRLAPVDTHLSLKDERNAVKHLWNTLSHQQYGVGFAATAMMSIGGFLLMPFGSAFAINNWGIGEGQLPLLFMIAGAGSLIAMPLIGRLSDKTDRFLIFATATVLLMLLVIYYTHMDVTPFWLAATVNLFSMVLVVSRMVPAMAVNSSVPLPADRGAYMSIASSLQQIAGGVAAAIAGMIIVQPEKHSPLQHMDVLGYLFCAISLLAIYLLYRVVQTLNSKAKLIQN